MLFTAKEKKNLKALLSMAVDPEEAFNLEELHGFLSGLAVMPEMIKPSEWLPVAFGEEMMEFKSSEEATAMMGHVFAVYNRLNSEYHQEQLCFPFDIRKLKGGDVQRMRDWTDGFYTALTLRHECWDLGDKDDEDLTEDEKEISTSLAVVLAVARPEHAEEIFDRTKDLPDEEDDDMHLTASLFAMLPTAVEVITAYARSLRRLDENDDSVMSPASDQFPKIGRNDPCPCGSGKKFKKCCLPKLEM
jgi:uncharacterized protein